MYARLRKPLAVTLFAVGMLVTGVACGGGDDSGKVDAGAGTVPAAAEQNLAADCTPTTTAAPAPAPAPAAPTASSPEPAPAETAPTPDPSSTRHSDGGDDDDGDDDTE